MEWPSDGPHRRNKGWGLASHVLLMTFIASFLILGFRHALMYDIIGSRPKVDFPDFNSIISYYKELSESEVNLNVNNSRLIFSGDVHGMNESLHDLLTKLSWDPSHDTLFFAGDLIAKSDHSDSLAVWDFIYKNHINDQGRQVIYPVRGNHDQIVVQWRAWRGWFEELALPSPPHRHPFQSFLPSNFMSFAKFSGLNFYDNDSESSTTHTGRDFLNLIEAEWAIASSSSRPTPPDPEEYVEVARKRARGTWREPWWARIPETPKHARDQKEWRMFSDHYWLARDMEKEAADWLMKEVPLVVWLSGLHTFVVHAGVLPGDPTLDMDDERQPLASVPKQIEVQEIGKVLLSSVRDEVGNGRPSQYTHAQEPFGPDLSTSSVGEYAQRNSNITALRRVQERSILTQIPQNTDPWVVLNMRSVKKNGDVTRNMDKGTPWSKLWADAMKHCRGFGLPGEDDISTDVALEHSEVASGDEAQTTKYKLKCYPSTIIYGHAATRGLDIKRWSFGLDTGCLYGGRLTALVLSRKGQSGSGEDEEDEDEEEEGEKWSEALFKKKRKQAKFGDADAHIKARLVSVKCPNPDDDDD